MKKLITLLILAFAFVFVQAQDFSISPRATYNYYTGTAADTVQGTNSISKTLLVEKDFLYYYEVLVDIDTLATGGGYGVSCILSGSNDNVNFSTITDVTFAASADTIIRYSNLSATGTQTLGSYTITQPAFNVTADTTGLSGYFADTLAYPQVVTTVGAQTITVPVENGVMWRYLKLTLTGDNASTYSELQAIRVKIVKVP